MTPNIYVIDPNTLSISTLPNASIPGDGIEGDGKGHLFIASQGNIFEYDLTAQSLTEVMSVPGLDDLAPLRGLGSSSTPEPATLVLVSIGAACWAGCRWRLPILSCRRQIRQKT